MTTTEHAHVLERQCAVWDVRVDDWLGQLEHIRALPTTCERDHRCSAHLSGHDSNMVAWLWCDECDERLRPLPAATQDARGACFTVQ